MCGPIHLRASGPPTRLTRPIASPSPYPIPTALAPAAQHVHAHVVAVSDVALVPVVGRERERQQLLLLHGAARPGCPRGGGRARPASQQAPGSPSATPPPAPASRRRRRSHRRSSHFAGVTKQVLVQVFSPVTQCPSGVQYISLVGIVILCGRILRGYAVLPGRSRHPVMPPTSCRFT